MELPIAMTNLTNRILAGKSTASKDISNVTTASVYLKLISATEGMIAGMEVTKMPDMLAVLLLSGKMRRK